MKPETDPIVEAVRARLHQRSQVGIAKYGTTTARSDLSLFDWANNSLEEALDLAVYLQRVIVGIESGEFPNPGRRPSERMVVIEPSSPEGITEDEANEALFELFTGLSEAISKYGCQVDISDPRRIVVTGAQKIGR
jgi:hypothetical protein